MRLLPHLCLVLWMGLQPSEGLLCSYIERSSFRLGAVQDMIVSGILVADQDACRSLCDQMDACLVWSYHYSRKCDLSRAMWKGSGTYFNIYLGWPTTSGYTTGVKHSCPATDSCELTIVGNGKFTSGGALYTDFTMSGMTEEICDHLCATNPLCVSTTFERVTKLCAAHRSGVGYEASANHVTKLKTACPDSLKPSTKAGSSCSFLRKASRRRLFDRGPGNNLQGYFVWGSAMPTIAASMEQCEALCAQLDQCAGLNYHAGSGQCELGQVIADDQAAAQSVGWESSVKQGCGLRCHFDTLVGMGWVTTSPLRDRGAGLLLSSAAECHAFCASFVDCPAAVWREDEQRCYAGSQFASWEEGTDIVTFVKRNCSGSPVLEQKRRCAFGRRSRGSYQFYSLYYNSNPIMIHFKELKRQTSEDLCQSFCRAQPDCVGYSFGPWLNDPAAPRCSAVNRWDYHPAYLTGDYPSQWHRQTAAFVAFCPASDQGQCQYTVFPGRHMRMHRVQPMIQDIPVSGRRECQDICSASEKCTSYTLRTIVMEVNALLYRCWTQVGWELGTVYYDEGPDADPEYEAGMKGECGGAGPARQCYFQREERDGVYEGRAELAPAQPVAGEDECQDLCEASQKRACVAYEYVQEKASAAKTCRQLAAIDLTSNFTQDDHRATAVPAPATSVRRVAHRDFCADGVGKDNYTRYEQTQVPDNSTYLIAGARVGSEEDCGTMCSVYGENCFGYTYRNYWHEVGDYLSICSILSAFPGIENLVNATNDNMTYVVGLKGGPRPTRRRLDRTSNFHLSPFPVPLPNVGELAPVTVARSEACSVRCFRDTQCFGFAFQDGHCRRFQDSEELEEGGKSTESALLWSVYQHTNKPTP